MRRSKRSTENIQGMIREELDIYRGASAPFFKFLHAQAKIGYNKNQFHKIRDNYLYRTCTTALSVSKVVVAALSQVPPDIETARQFSLLNLCDELGRETSSASHLSLLLNSFNLQSHKVFGLEPASIEHLEVSRVLLPEAIGFRKIQAELYESPSYLRVLAASAAQELSAPEMIQTLFKAVFVPFKNVYTAKQWSIVAEYFKVHLDGTEKRHGDNAIAALDRKIESASELGEARRGMRVFLHTQTSLWRALHSQIAPLHDS